MEYTTNNKGAMWLNDKATEENKQPYMSGTCEINGKKMDVAAWRTPATEGKKARMDLKFQPPRTKEVPAVNNATTSTTADAEIPF